MRESRDEATDIKMWQKDKVVSGYGCNVGGAMRKEGGFEFAFETGQARQELKEKKYR